MIRKIIADGTSEVAFLKEVEKRNGEYKIYEGDTLIR